MKRLSLHSASCSCTSCVYRSRSKQPSVQELLADGSRIDKLYYGKYLPLRERKLLEKLIRTRAVYDDVRNQLVSSGSSDRTRSEHKIKRREDDSTEKSSAVLKMVDLVDRGHIGTSNTSKLSSCCSCCSCRSLRKIKKQMDKHPPPVHRHNVPLEAIARYTIEAEKKGRKRRKKLSSKISSKMRAVHFKMKSIKSEPCTCTLSLSSVLTRPSKAFMSKVRAKELGPEDAKAQKVVKVERKSLKKKLCSCPCKIAKLPMKSIRKFRSIRPSMTKRSGTDQTFKIRKDSLTLFREKLLKKRAVKDWECEPGICNEDECIPEQCLKKKTRGVGSKRRRKAYSRYSGTSRERRSRISISTRPLKVKLTDSRIQATQKPKLGPVSCECKPPTKSESSMTKFHKQKSLTQVTSTTAELQAQRIKSPKAKPRSILKESSIEERVRKSYSPKRTESIVYRDKKQVLPEPKLKSDVCECKSATKSSSSMTTILKRQTMQSVSKSEIKVRRPSTPKQRPQFEKNEIRKKEKKYKTSPSEREFDHSLRSFPKISKAMKPKPKPKLVIREEEGMAEKAKPQAALKDKDKQQVTSKSKLGHALCECKPSTRSSSSMTTDISKSEVLSRSRSKIMKSKPKLVMTERVQQKGIYKRQPTHETLYIREKKPVKYSEKSKLSDVTCECKPPSKSSFSMTSLSKPTLQVKQSMRSPKRPKQERKIIMIRHKPRRRKHTKYETPYQAHEEPEKPESGKKAVKISSSFKFEIEFSKKLNPTLTNRELIDHVEKKRARRMKSIRSGPHHRKYRHSKTQVPGGLSKSSQDSQISYFRESASQASKPYRESVLPFPRECEPLMCIPYECDPQNCARILLSRSKSRERSTKSSTRRLRRKSVGSTTYSEKTYSKSKYIQSKSTDTFTRKPKGVLNNPPPQNIERNIRAENTHPPRQAVRISSNFSFDIEFYKDKSPAFKPNGAQDFLAESQKKAKHTEYRRKYKERGHGTRDSPSRQNISSQSRSSQSFKNIQVGHRLKRCFCTLRLLQKKKPKITHVVSRKTMASYRTKELDNIARKQQTQTKSSSGMTYVLTPVTSALDSLLPYECEPYFCTPGECNPYDCAERIKERNRKETRRFSKDTNTNIAKKRSFSAFTSQPLTKSFSKGIQYRERKHRKPKSRYSYSSKEESKVSSGKKDKQAVRIGSSFTFDIEFSKRTNNPLNLHEQETTKVMKREKKHLQHRGIKVYKPRIRHENSGTNIDVKTKQTHTEPFLRKCFCTLKLLKKSKKKVETAPLRSGAYVMQMQTKTITTNRADIHYNYERSKIRPFEYMCIPDERNPYKCENLLQLREINSQNKYSNMADLATPSTLSHIAQTINSSNTRYTPPNKKDSNKINIVSSRSKQQAVHVGSTFNFDIELLKEKSPQKSKSRGKVNKEKIKKHDPKINRLDTIGSQEFEQADVENKRNKKGTSIGAVLKRCFCKFKFPSKNNNATQQNKNNFIHKRTNASYPLSNHQIYGKSAKKISQLPIPNIWEGKTSNINKPLKMCDSYNCFEENKRQEIKQSHDHHFNTDKYNKSVMSANTNSVSGSSKSKSTQSRLLQRTSTKEKKMRFPQKDVRLKDVRKSSKVSLNAGLSNNRFAPSIPNIRRDKHNSGSKTSTVNKIKGTNDEQVALKNGFLKSEKVRKEDKASTVGHLLKRCFCTLGLQKKCTKPETQMLKSGTQNKLPFTRQLVHIQSNENSETKKLNCSTLDKYRYGGVPLELKLPKDPLKEYIFGHQNLTKNIRMENSTSFEKRLKAGINLNFNEYQVGYLINTQRLSPFYQSFYALNLKVSKVKNISENIHVLENNQCEPGICISYDYDPVQCLKKINSRLKVSKLSETDRPESKSVECYEKNKVIKSKIVRANGKSRFGKHQGKPMIVGSDLSINIGIYKDTKHQLRKKQTAETCLHPIVKKTMPSPRKAVRVGSDVRVAMSFYKEKKQQNDGITSTSLKKPRHSYTVASQSTQRQLRHSESQVSYQGRSKATGISNFISRCFCTSKLINDSQRKPDKKRNKKNNKPEKSKKGNKKSKPTKPKKNKKYAVSEKSQTCQQKNIKICKVYKCEGTSVNKPCRNSIGACYPKHKSTASLLSKSRKSIKSRSVQSKGKDWSSRSNYCVQKKRNHRDNPMRQSHNVTFGSNIHFDMEFFKDRSQGRGDQMRSGPIVERCKSKKPCCKGNKSAKYQEYSEGLLDPNQCEPNTCVPNKCSSIKCEKRINNRRLRSKNTKVKTDMYAPSAKSIATDTGITRSNGRSKSIRECYPHDCDKLAELGIIQPDFSKTSKKGKYNSSSMQNDEDRSILNNYTKQNKSILKCFCVLTQRTSKQPETIQTNERCTDTCNKSNFSTFIEKCFCTLKHFKGGKQLRPKPSTEQIVPFKNTGITKASETLKPSIKLEKKSKTRRAAAPEGEMQTIMPYSKKKFKQLESQTKLGRGPANKHKEETDISQNFTKVVMFCPICKKVSNTKPSKQSRNTCLCPNEKCMCLEGGLCPVCLDRAGAKYDKKAKKIQFSTCMGDGNEVEGRYLGNKGKRKEKQTRSRKKGKNVPLQEEEQCQKSVCPCCKRKCSLETVKNIKESMKRKIFSMCSFLNGNKGKGKRIKPVKNIDSDPLFELLVNKNNMSILNREEVLKNLGSSGKESRAMKKARKAIQNGEVSSPLIEMIIDRKNASIVNKDDIIRQINREYLNKVKQKDKKQPKNLAVLEPAQITDSQPKGQGKRSSKSHGSKCKCCFCSKLRKKSGSKPKMKPRKLKPCICGSVICKKDWQKLKKEERSIKSLKIKPCVCGSNICREESQKMPELLLQAARQAQEDKEQAKQDIINEKIYQKARLQRKKLYAKEDKKLRKIRQKEDKREMKSVRKYDTAPDILMVAESLIDLGSFGAKAFCDIMKSASRVVRHPRDGVYHVKDAIDNPRHAAKEIKQSLKRMGLFSTLSRIKRRMLKMPLTRGAITKLESYPVTNYLVHVADRDPKKRMKKFKQKRYREPLDFQCSLYMASLRKRPCLKVYYMCPWFYPHCIGLLAMWKQFTDILLFLLAVGVWSPCILCMEFSRILMCFIFCSGG